MNICTPEQAGIATAHVRRFYQTLENYHLSTHSVILSRGDAIFSECYYAPFHKEFLHRMYSVSKTFVSVAIGFCEQDGLLSLDDPLMKFFPEYVGREGAAAPRSTVRDMLMMKTTVEGVINWFKMHPENRVDTYFAHTPEKLPGTHFKYDSSASYILGVIVERLTGKPFLAYLQEKVLNDIGFSKNAYCLKAPGGYSWGDSGVMCTARDLLLFARFVLNGGTFGGKRYLNEAYLKAATTMAVSDNDYGFVHHSGHGYGYQIWGAPRGCYAMLGMGNQIALCDPVHDFIFVINSDNQGHPHNYEMIFDALYDHIIGNLQQGPLAPDRAASDALDAWLSTRRLFALTGPAQSELAAKINDKTYVCGENPMGIKWFRVALEKTRGVFHYENAQGVKQMPFGFGYNEFAQFPQEGYADTVGNTYAPGNTYRAAFSADWPEPKRLRIRVQVIDKYFGNLAIVLGFCDENSVTLRMSKTAEDFLAEYNGVAIATAK
ncbi:MAG: serine hydrolase [Ruminococcaceae bacterium]|nr:serine hydrolase [Oscillospiraceae bacterium]